MSPSELPEISVIDPLILSFVKRERRRCVAIPTQAIGLDFRKLAQTGSDRGCPC
jgi:hypothetical protein